MKRIFIILIFSLLHYSCDSILPIPSKSGKNIFGCKIEGKVIKPETVGLFSKPLVAKMSSTTFSVLATDYGDKYSVDIVLNDISKKGKYTIDGLINGAFVYKENSPTIVYQVTSRQKSEVCITKFDTSKKIVSGTFEFEAVNRKDSTDIIKVTKGRFDLKID